MQCNITYDTGMYAMLSKIGSEIQIFNFVYLSSEYSVFTRKESEDPWLFFEAKRGPRAKKDWETLVLSDSCLWYPWLWAYCSCELFGRRPVAYRSRGLGIQFVFFLPEIRSWREL
jgi:hypothetical protein